MSLLFLTILCELILRRGRWRCHWQFLNLIKVKPSSHYYWHSQNRELKFGRSEEGTKFGKIFHFQFDVTQ